MRTKSELNYHECKQWTKLSWRNMNIEGRNNNNNQILKYYINPDLSSYLILEYNKIIGKKKR